MSGPSWRDQLQAVALAALCGIAFLGPGVLPGRAVVPFPPEALEPLKSEVLASGERRLDELLVGNSSMGDKYNQSLAWDRITGDALRAGRLPHWTRDIGGGASFVPQMGQIYQPWTWLLLLVGAPDVYGPWFLLHQILFGWLGYRFLRRIGARHLGGLFGVTALVLGLWLQARIHHNVIVSAVLPVFWMLSCVHALFTERAGARAAGQLALGTGLSWLGGMPQASLQCTYLVLAYALLLTPSARGQRLRAWTWVGVGLAVGGLLACAQMLPVLRASEVSSRTAATAAGLAFRALEYEHLLGFVWPDLFHWPAEQFYGGAIDMTRPSWAALLAFDPEKAKLAAVFNWPETACSVGIPGLLLAVYGARTGRPQREALFFAGVAAIGVFFATATSPFFELTAILPGARAGDLKRFLLLPALALPVLAALGLDRLADRPPRLVLWLGALILVASAGLFAVSLLTPKAFEDTFVGLAARKVDLPEAAVRGAIHRGAAGDETAANRTRLQQTGRHALVIVIGALAFLGTRHRRSTPWVLILLNAMHLVLVGRGPVVTVASERVQRPPAILAPVFADTAAANPGARPRFQRLLPAGLQSNLALFPPNLGAYFGLEDLAAYNPLPPRAMEELFGTIEEGMQLKGAGVTGFRQPASLDHPLLDVLGLRWVLAAQPVQLTGIEDRTPPDTKGSHRLYERMRTLPRATFVTRARVIEDPARRLAALADRGRDCARETILERAGARIPTPGPDEVAAVYVLRHEDEHVTVRVQTMAAGYLRIADPYDAGWTATVDGAPAEILRADHYLRAVWCEPGTHMVELRYDAAAVVWPERLSLLGIGGALVLLLLPRRRPRAEAGA